MAQCEHGLDQADYTCGSLEMAQIRFGRPKKTWSSVGGQMADGLGDRLDLDRIAESGTGAVRLEEADAPGLHLRCGKSLAD